MSDMTMSQQWEAAKRVTAKLTQWPQIQNWQEDVTAVEKTGRSKIMKTNGSAGTVKLTRR